MFCWNLLIASPQARVSLARAVYSQADVVLLDDPLSAVDAYVGKRIVEDCFLSGPLATRTRVLVTHMLHVLDKTDYIYVMDNGRIIEQGSYVVSSVFSASQFQANVEILFSTGSHVKQCSIPSPHR
jgi:ABC-type transport system involved in cytochrome bd biosynthesis fused ATPase/permease subunit